MSSSLQPHGLRSPRLLCPSLSPRVCSHSHSLSQGCHPTISSSVTFLLLPSIFLSIRVFLNKSALRIRWPKYWSFSFSISPSNGYSGLISFRIDWFGLLWLPQMVKNLPAMQETWVRSLGWKDSPGEGNGYPLQYSCLENPMNRGVWWATVHGVAESGTQLSD